MSGTTRPFGRYPFGASVYSRYRTYSAGGVSRVSFTTYAEMRLTWQPPSQMCEAGTWTLTHLPDGPPNELEPVA